MNAVPTEARRGFRTSRIRVTGGYKPTNIDSTGNQKWFFWKSSKYSQLLSHLSSPDVILNKSHERTAYKIKTLHTRMFLKTNM